MTDHPIIFSAPMIQALLDGRKSMTRRLAWMFSTKGVDHWRPSRWQKVKPGDRLWVRETWAHDGPDLATVKETCFDIMPGSAIYGPYYRATEVAPDTLNWRSPIFLPRWASRLTLIVTATKIERLHDISEEDAILEGCAASPETISYWWDGYDNRLLDRDGNAASVSVIAGGKYTDVPPEWMEVTRKSKMTKRAVSARERFFDLWRIFRGTDSINPEIVALSVIPHTTNIDQMPQAEAA